MICNLFSSFDPSLSLEGSGFQFKWYSSFILLLFIYWQFFVGSVGMMIFMKELFLTALSAVKISFVESYKKFYMILLSLFISILLINELGMINPTFTASSHLSFNLSISLPMWIGGLIFMFYNSWKNFVIHLVPSGCPMALIPLLILIESVSLLIRPISLGVRLMSNIMAGHMILTLINLSLVSLIPSLSFLFVFLIQSFIFTFELGIALIQSYVFSSLMMLYWQDNF
nr:ATP synthase F0 subunit 6 [Anatoecus icterodes]UTT72533.1 ATP synthase F0 subunit 6 [Anatoecus icterodes]